MRFLNAVMLMAYGAAASSSCLAHDDEPCLMPDGESVPICHHYFAGTTIDLPVRDTLEGIDAGCEHLIVRVLQRQGSFLAQLGEPLEFGAEECSTMNTISLDLPNVRSETDLLIQFATTVPASDQNDDHEQSADVIALRVYPDTILDPLLRFAEDKSIVVFDDEGQLSDFLDSKNIKYRRGHEAISGVPVGLLVQQQEPERLLEDRGIDTAVLFQEKVVDLPQIRAVSNNGQARVYVEMRLLGDLNSSPLAQKALIKIIKLAINPNPIDRG